MIEIDSETLDAGNCKQNKVVNYIMDYVEAFQNLRTNNKYGRRSPHKAVMMLTVIELYEQNELSENEIVYDDSLKTMFLQVWNRVLPDEPLFHPEAYLPFWYLQSDSFWHMK